MKQASSVIVAFAVLIVPAATAGADVAPALDAPRQGRLASLNRTLPERLADRLQDQARYLDDLRPGETHVPGEVIVRFDRTVTAGDKAAILNDLKLDLIAQGRALPGLHLLKTPPGLSVPEAVRKISARTGVLYAEPNYYRSHAVAPDDPGFAAQWGLHNTGQTVEGRAGFADADIDAPEAWQVSTGSSNVVVAVVDSGIDYEHADLAPNLWFNPGESGSGRETNRIDDDANGYIDDFNGWDFVYDNNDPYDAGSGMATGHGTHVSGTIGAAGNDGVGVTGVNWSAGLLPLKVFGSSGKSPNWAQLEAYAYAGRSGAKVVNASLGLVTYPSQAEADVIRRSANTLFVFAAGNGGDDDIGDNNDTMPTTYPCSYSLENVLCVANTGNRDDLAFDSNYGVNTVHLGAPGTNILSTVPGGWDYSSGTSMASPHVAGAAALLFSAKASATVTEVKNALLTSVDRIPSLEGKVFTGGRLNAARAIAHLTQPPSDVPPQPSSFAVSATLNLRKHLIAKGAVFSDSAACVPFAPVAIYKKTRTGWKFLKSRYATEYGRYRFRLADKPGKYAVWIPGGYVDDVTFCLDGYSFVKVHRH